MTLIAACVGADSAWMVGDSAVSQEDGIVLCSATPKIAARGGWLVGAAGDAGSCTALLARAWPSDPRALIRALRGVGGEWEALLARPGALYVADSDGDLEAISRRYWAIGSGAQVGLGVMAASRARTPRSLLMQASRITESLRGDVRGPFSILSA